MCVHAPYWELMLVLWVPCRVYRSKEILLGCFLMCRHVTSIHPQLWTKKMLVYYSGFNDGLSGPFYVAWFYVGWKWTLHRYPVLWAHIKVFPHALFNSPTLCSSLKIDCRVREKTILFLFVHSRGGSGSYKQLGGAQMLSSRNETRQHWFPLHFLYLYLATGEHQSGGLCIGFRYVCVLVQSLASSSSVCLVIPPTSDMSPPRRLCRSCDNVPRLCLLLLLSPQDNESRASSAASLLGGGAPWSPPGHTRYPRTTWVMGTRLWRHRPFRQPACWNSPWWSSAVPSKRWRCPESTARPHSDCGLEEGREWNEAHQSDACNVAT